VLYAGERRTAAPLGAHSPGRVRSPSRTSSRISFSALGLDRVASWVDIDAAKKRDEHVRKRLTESQASSVAQDRLRE
jgi:hypothetical protein